MPRSATYSCMLYGFVLKPLYFLSRLFCFDVFCAFLRFCRAVKTCRFNHYANPEQIGDIVECMLALDHRDAWKPWWPWWLKCKSFGDWLARFLLALEQFRIVTRLTSFDGVSWITTWISSHGWSCNMLISFFRVSMHCCGFPTCRFSGPQLAGPAANL